MATILLTAFFGIGCILVIGARQKWAWLVDPPDEMWPFYSQAFIKRFFGRRVLIGYTYVTGGVFMLLSLAFFLNGLQ